MALALRGSKEEAMATNFLVNGKAATTDAPPVTPLLWGDPRRFEAYRHQIGCGAGLCGACMVHIDKKPAFSRQTQLSEVAGKSVTTIEGLSRDWQHPARMPGSPSACRMRLLSNRLDHERGRSARAQSKPTREQIVEHMRQISAVAAPISASCARSSARRGRCDMNAHTSKSEAGFPAVR